MLADKHYDYEKESRYLEKTLEVMDNEMRYLEDEIEGSKEEIDKFKKGMGGNYNDEIVVKLTIHESYEKKLRMLNRAKDKPYFGRIDFKDIQKDDFESFYIGKTSIARREDEKRFVIDWRTPLAGLYYSGEIGEVMYTAPGGLILGELKLKRQYEIKDRELVNIFDKGLTPMDEYLQEALWEKKDNRLRDIVTTIQGEQNDIIRADEGKVIIVQGVAGSGKTTIVLHRIAYLMYAYQELFPSDKLLIIVPNRLFLNYISDVLPDLGVEEINQSTFEDLALKLLGEDINITSNEEKFYKLLETSIADDKLYGTLTFTSSFKGSLYFKNIIDRYINDLVEEMCPREPLIVDNYEVFPMEEIERMFKSQYCYLPLIPRLNRIKKYIKDNIKGRIKAIQEDITNKYNKIANEAKKAIDNDEELRKRLINIYDERDFLKERLEKSMNTAIINYFSRFEEIDVVNAYRDIITDKKLLLKYIEADNKDIDNNCKSKVSEENIDFLTQYSKDLMSRDYIEREDLPPLLYLHMQLLGSDLKGRYNHIVVDEAQDYSEFQMFILRELSSNNSFTIVGDLSQGIHSYKGIKTWDSFIKDVFGEGSIEFLTLRKCYRSTMEIMTFANEVIKKWNNDSITLAEPVLRSGDKPIIIGKDNQEQILEDIVRKLDELTNEGHKSIAIICKDNAESSTVHKALKNKYDKEIHMITDKDTAYDGGIVVIPAYMSKGLEFDVVIVFDCSEEKYHKKELDIKLLYVALTRPLHKLYIYYYNKPSPLIEVRDELYITE